MRFLLLAFLLMVNFACDRAKSPDIPPNLLVVVVDDMRFDDVGAYGHPFVTTPHIDRIAREGMRFDQAFAATPLCSPSRGTILTGLYPHRNGISDNTDRSRISHELMTFPRVLHDAGYETAFIGKWHMGNDETRRPGFDYWVSMKGQGEATDPELHENGETTRYEGYVTDLLTDRAVDFINQERERPFVLFLAHKALHPNLTQHDDGSVTSIGGGGFIPAERHKDLFADDPIPRRASYGVPPKGKPALERTIADLPPLGPETVTDDETIRDRLRMLVAVDESLGRMLDALEAKGELDRTVVVVTSDHGYFYGEHGLSAERRLAYEETMRIPLVVRYPELAAAGSSNGAFVSTIDFAPTFLELGGVEPSRNLDGRSLVPLLRGETPTDWRQSVLVEYYTDIVFPRMLTMGYRAVRTDRIKYIRYTDLHGMDELYDLVKDPNEMENVIGTPEYERALSDMRTELLALGAYAVRRSEGAEPSWEEARAVTWGPGHYPTTFRALASNEGLHLRFDVVDPAPWSTMTERDQPIWEEEVVEIFMDLDGSGTNYAEVELSPANVVTDLRMIRGVPNKEGDISWNLEGLESRVSSSDSGWTGYLFLPWDGFRSLPSAAGVSLPPEPGDRWRFNLYRIKRPGGPEDPNKDVVFAAWSPTGDPSFHVPASFQELVF